MLWRKNENSNNIKQRQTKSPKYEKQDNDKPESSEIRLAGVPEMKSKEKREEMNKIMKENFPELNVIFSYAVRDN